MHAITSSLVAISLLGATLVGQTNSDGGKLVGVVGPTGIGISIRGEFYKQNVDNNCAAAKKVGNQTGLSMAIRGGGTAYDAARKAAWVSDGTKIALQQTGAAQVSCLMSATLSGTGTGYTVTGLAHCNKRKELVQMELVVGSSSNSMVLRFYDTSACPPKLLKTTCSFPIPSGNTAGIAHGLAYDEARDLIFWTTSQNGTAGWTNTVNYINYAVACLSVKPKSFTLPVFTKCGGTNGAVKAMTYNSCTQILYVTEGTVMLKMDLSNLASPKNLNASQACCKFAVKGKGWAGLAIVPKSVTKSVGTSCLGTGCPNCSSMSLAFVGGDLALGNKDLALQITGAPGGGLAGFYLSPGNCQTPGFSLLCGAVHPVISAGLPLFIGNFPLSGTSCAGTLKLPTPVPSSASLCNLPICAQFLIRCPQGGLAAGFTNALEFSVGG
jgi:hypothetical protein